MPREIPFWKASGTGNDFIVVDNRAGLLDESELAPFAVAKCPRRTAVGADGVLLIEKSRNTDFRMRLFNSDGSEAEMCGNGIRCVALVAMECGAAGASQRVTTLAGLIGAEVAEGKVRVTMTSPGDIKLVKGLKVFGKSFDARFLNTGVPHAVIFVDDVDDVPIREWGQAIRAHERFKPAGTNVDFVRQGQDELIIRTYERGVEDETLACGTGCVAAAAVAVAEDRLRSPVRLQARGGTLSVHIGMEAGIPVAAKLEGPAEITFRGHTTWGR